MSIELEAALRTVTDRVYKAVKSQWPDFAIEEYETKVQLAHRILSGDATPTGVEFAKLYAEEAGSDDTPLSQTAWAEQMVAQEFHLLGVLRGLRELHDGGLGLIQNTPDAGLPQVVEHLYNTASASAPAFAQGDHKVETRIRQALQQFNVQGMRIAQSLAWPDADDEFDDDVEAAVEAVDSPEPDAEV